MSSLGEFATIDLVQLAIAGAAAFAASLMGGITGYGVGLVLPLVLTPLVGITLVLPVAALATVITNAGRATAFRDAVDLRIAWKLLAVSLPACAAGAWGFSQLKTSWMAALLGSLLMLSVVWRRLGIASEARRLNARAVTVAAIPYGVLAGAMTGTGLFLLVILRSAGLTGAALIGTDATVSLALNLLKMVVFGLVLPPHPQALLVGGVVGVCTVPGAYLGRRWLHHMPPWAHTTLMDVVIVCGGVSMLWSAAHFKGA